jgi:hypothetical protein
MTTITILPEDKSFRAVAGQRESVGRTAGEALDALTAQLNDDESSTLLVIQTQRPDKFFGVKERKRLSELMSKKENRELSLKEASELEKLVEAELNGARRRAEELVGGLKP